MTAARWWWCTAPAPGAVAVACVTGTDEELDAIAQALTGQAAPPPGAVARRLLAHVDDGVLARVDRHTLLAMPHGGARIRAKLCAALTSAGAHEGTRESAVEAAAVYPEAADALEALALAQVARAASPRAVALLLAQPERWRGAIAAGSAPTAPSPCDAIRARLLTPARVVVTGAANAGKSTLMNALAGRAVAVAHDEPGTTRDAVAARLDLDGVVVDWFDTPGIRAFPDAAESAAAAIASSVVAHADLIVQLAAPGLGWHAIAADNANIPVLRVLNKSDTPSAQSCAEAAGATLTISAQRGDGIAALVQTVRELLVPAAVLLDPSPWWFSAALPVASCKR